VFQNPHTVEAIVPVDVVRARKHKNVLKDDEIDVYWPCYMHEETKFISTGKNTKIQIDATMSVPQTPDVVQKLHAGMYLRFKHDPTHYFKVYDFKVGESMLGGSSTYDLRLVRQDMPLQPTQKRTSFDPDEDYVLTDVSDEPPPPPGVQRRRWGY